jgi:hypothetical protein
LFLTVCYMTSAWLIINIIKKAKQVINITKTR